MKWNKIHVITLYLIFSFITIIQSSACDDIISAHLKDSTDIKPLISKSMFEIKNDDSCIEKLLQKGLIKETEFLLEELNKRNISFKDQLKQATSNISNKAKEIYNLFRFEENEYVNASPAFQWAQNLEFIFIQIKYAHRFDSPGCLEVKKEEITIDGNVLNFSALCLQGDTPIKFSLTLDLFDNIDKEHSVFSSSSVGRMQLNLKKEKVDYWKSLLKQGSEAPSNMRMWIEMREKYIEEIQKYIDITEEEETKEADEEIKLIRNKGEKKEERTTDL